MRKLLFVAQIVILLLLTSTYVNAYDYSQIQDKLSRGILKRNPTFLAPNFHPFFNEKELKRENAMDALGGFLSKHTRSSIVGGDELYTLGSHYQLLKSKYGKHKKSFTESLESLGVNVQDQVDYENPHSKSRTIYNYKAVMFRGTVNLDIEDDVVDVTCQRQADKQIALNDEHTIKVHFKNTPMGKKKMKQWVPGTRFIVPASFKCGSKEANEKGEAAFYMMVRRKELTTTATSTMVTYVARVQRLEHMFVKSSIEFKYDPPSKNLDDEFLFEDEEEDELVDWVMNKQSKKPALFHKNRRSSIDVIRSSGTLKFNYGMGRSKSQFSYGSSLLCTNCYSLLQFQIHFKLSIVFFKIKEFRFVVGGRTQTRIETNLKFLHRVNREWHVKNIAVQNLKELKFSVGIIPVKISPHLSLESKLNANVGANLNIKQGATLNAVINLGVDYHNSQFKPVKFSKSKTWTVDRPQVLSSSSLWPFDLKVTLIPKLIFKFYDLSPLEIRYSPSINIIAHFNRQKQISYGIYEGLGFKAYMEPLIIGNNIIGHKKFKFGGLLPFKKEMTLVDKKLLKCRSCSGKISLVDNFRSLSSPNMAPNHFRNYLLPQSHTPLQLGKDYDQLLQAEKCKTFTTTNQFLSSNSFKFKKKDTRAIIVEIKTEDDPVNVKFIQKESNNQDVLVNPGKTYREKLALNMVKIQICNTNSKNATFKISTRPYAKLPYGSVNIPNAPKDAIFLLEFVDEHKESYRSLTHDNFIQVSQSTTLDKGFTIQGTGYYKNMTITKSNTMNLLVPSSRNTLDFKYKEGILDKFNHAEHDYSMLLTLQGKHKSNSATISVGNYLTFRKMDDSIDVSYLDGIKIYDYSKFYSSQMILKNQKLSFCVVENTKSECFSNRKSSFSKVNKNANEITELYNMQVSTFSLKYLKYLKPDQEYDFSIDKGSSEVIVVKPEKPAAFFYFTNDPKFKNPRAYLTIKEEIIEVQESNSDEENYFNSAMKTNNLELTVAISTIHEVDVKDLKEKYGEKILIRYTISSNIEYKGNFRFCEWDNVDSMKSLTGTIMSNENEFETPINVYKISPEILAGINNHLYLTVDAVEGSLEVMLSKNQFPSFDPDKNLVITSNEKHLSLGYETNSEDTYYIGVTTAESNAILNYSLQLKTIDKTNVDFSIVSNPEKRIISDEDIRKHGLKLTYRITDGPHQWSSIMTDIYSDSLAGLYTRFMARGDFKKIIDHLDYHRQRALNPSDPFDIDDFLQLTPMDNPTTLIITMPPKEDFFIMDRIDVTIAKEKLNLDNEFFDTRMSNILTGGYSFSIVPHEKINYTYSFIFVGITMFVLLVIMTSMFLLFVLAKSFCKRPNRLKRKVIHMEEGLF